MRFQAGFDVLNRTPATGQSFPASLVGRYWDLSTRAHDGYGLRLNAQDLGQLFIVDQVVEKFLVGEIFGGCASHLGYLRKMS
jgi:hypothetical protein